MLSENYNLKIIDFGDAKKIDDEFSSTANGQMNSKMPKEQIERRGTFVGTMNFMSPEVINEDEQGFPLDIWAAGCILFKMLYGTVPFPGTNLNVYNDIKTGKIRWPRQDVIDTISKEAQDLIVTML